MGTLLSQGFWEGTIRDEIILYIKIYKLFVAIIQDGIECLKKLGYKGKTNELMKQRLL